MSAALPECPVCLSPSLRGINELMQQGTENVTIVNVMRRRRRGQINRGRYRAEDFPELNIQHINDHARECVIMGAPRRVPKYIAADDVPTPGEKAPPPPPPITVSAAELADPARRLDLLREALGAKIGDLSAKDLLSMYMAELKLQTAQAARPAEREPETDDGLTAAMAAAAGHRPDLRLVKKRA